MHHSELKAAREALGISQSEMAVRLTMPRNTYLRWESGATKKLPPDLAERLVAVAGGVKVHKAAVGEEMVLLTADTHPEYYDKQRGANRGWHVAANHPTGSSGPIKRKYLDAYVAGGRSAMETLQREDEATEAPTPRTTQRQPSINSVDNPPYAHTGADDDEIEQRLKNFFL